MTNLPTRAQQQQRQQRQHRLVIQVVAVAAAASLGLFVLYIRSTSTHSTAAAPEAGVVGAGQAAPQIRLPATSGATFDLGAEKGKTVLLYFQEGVGCEPCWKQIHDIEADWASFKAAGIDELVSIAGNKLDQLKQKVDDEQLTTPVVADPDLTLGATYKANQFGMMGTSAYGHTFIVVGPDGTITWRADYGGQPNYTMYVKPADVLRDLKTGTGRPG